VIVNRRVRAVFVFEALLEWDQAVLCYFVGAVEKADRVWVGRRLIEAAEVTDGGEVD
jgi:hypothetical protein